MADNLPTNTNNSSDEIDLGQLFAMIKNGLRSVFIGFLQVFLYIKRSIITLAILVLIGVGIGYGLKQISTITKKTEVIVKPNFESKDYLYGVVNELQSKIIGRDYEFYNSIGIDLKSTKGFKIEIEPVQDSEVKVNLEESLKYLSYLGNLKDDNSIKQVIKNEVLSSSYVNHKISFSYKEDIIGQDAAHKLMKHINNNGYFKELREIYLNNAESRIKENEGLIQQVDVLVTNYSKALGNKNGSNGAGTVLLGGEEGLNIPQLLTLKNSLIQSTASSKLVINEQQDTIKILNFGGPQQIKTAFFSTGIVQIPMILISLFFIWSLLKFLNKKAKELV